MIRSSRPEKSRKKGVLKDLQEHTCVGVSFLIALFKTESNAGAFLFLQNFSETFFIDFLWTPDLGSSCKQLKYSFTFRGISSCQQIRNSFQEAL